MKKKRPYKRTGGFVLLVLAFALLPVTAAADMGPKPSVTVDFQGLEGEVYYATLLSNVESTGPWSVGGGHSGEKTGVDGEAWESFRDYPEKDGFYFLGFQEECTQTHTMTWGYYPPQEFRILLYFPQYGTFADSGEVYSRYAFASGFTADLSGVDPAASSGQARMRVKKAYNWGGEVPGLLFRIVLTIAIELAVGLLFRFRRARQIRLICFTNLATQAALNLALNLVQYYRGFWLFETVPLYFLLEAAVLAVECAVYRKRLPRFGDPGVVTHPCAYAAAANLASFAVGLVLMFLVPQLF